MTEKRIKEILGKKNEMICKIVSQRTMALNEIKNKDAILEAVAYQPINITNSTSKSNNHKDLYDVLERQEKIMKESNIVYLEMLNSLMEEEEEINRIWICFNQLPLEQYEILYRLYVLGQKYEFCKSILEIDHRTFIDRRQCGMRNILSLYGSEYSDREIVQNKYNIVFMKDKDKRKYQKKTIAEKMMGMKED